MKSLVPIAVCATLCSPGLAAIPVVLTAPAVMNLVTNGNFSQGAPASGCAAGLTSVSGWTLSSGNVDWVQGNHPGCGLWAVPDSAPWFLDLTGSYAEYGVNNVATLSQNLPTQAGQNYQLGFCFGANPAGQYLQSYPDDGSVKSLEVLINNVVVGTFSINVSGVSEFNAQWTPIRLLFTAPTNLTSLTFKSLSKKSDFGPMITDVRVIQSDTPFLQTCQVLQ